jgi:hypothetical protein
VTVSVGEGGTLVLVEDGCGVSVAVGTAVGTTRVFVGVNVLVAVGVTVRVGDLKGVKVLVGMRVLVGVGVTVLVLVGPTVTLVGDAVNVVVLVEVGVFVPRSRSAWSLFSIANPIK